MAPPSARGRILAAALVCVLVPALGGGLRAGQQDDYRAYIAAAEGALRAQDSGAVMEWLEAASRRHRNWEWGYLRAAADVSETTLEAGMPLESVACHSTGTLLAAGATTGRLGIWDLDTRRLLAAVSAHDGVVYVVALRPEAPGAGRTVLATAGGDARVRLWELKRPDTLPEPGRQEGVDLVPLAGFPTGERKPLGLAFSPDGRLLAASLQEGTLMVWDAERHEEIARLVGHAARPPVPGVAFLDARRIVSGSWDQTVKLWDLDSHEEIASLSPGHGREGAAYSPFSAVAADPGGRWIAGVGRERSVHIWRVDGWQETVLPGHGKDIPAEKSD